MARREMIREYRTQSEKGERTDRNQIWPFLRRLLDAHISCAGGTGPLVQAVRGRITDSSAEAFEQRSPCLRNSTTIYTRVYDLGKKLSRTAGRGRYQVGWLASACHFGWQYFETQKRAFTIGAGRQKSAEYDFEICADSQACNFMISTN